MLAHDTSRFDYKIVRKTAIVPIPAVPVMQVTGIPNIGTKRTGNLVHWFVVLPFPGD